MGSLVDMAIDIVKASADRTVAPSSPPEESGWEPTKNHLSNLDQEVPAGLEEAMRSGQLYCDYHAWNFNAKVWFESGKFHAYVLSYRKHVGTYEADSLKGLMTACSDAHGYE